MLEPIKGPDGSFSAFNKKFQQSYHARSIGAMEESLLKHINPAREFASRLSLKRPVRVLDICFGLGYNALLSLLHFRNIEVYSPEEDSILPSLSNFPYPDALSNIGVRKIIASLQDSGVYKAGSQSLYFLHGDATQLIESFPNKFFDVVYQDAFSASTNPELWSTRYFRSMYRVSSNGMLVTTYAKAKGVLNRAKEAGFVVCKSKYGCTFSKLQ